MCVSLLVYTPKLLTVAAVRIGEGPGVLRDKLSISSYTPAVAIVTHGGPGQ